MPPLNRLLDEPQQQQQQPSLEFWNSETSRSFDAFPEQPFKSPDRPRRRRRRARFQEHVQVCPVIQRCEFTPEELEACWYTGREYVAFKQDIATTVYLIKNDPYLVDGHCYTSRGAECRIDQVVSRRHQLKRRVWYAVLDEESFRGRNEQSIASVYGHMAESSVKEALDLAAYNAYDAAGYQEQVCIQMQPVILQEFFTDEWISSISNSSHDFAFAHRPKDPFFVDDSGFDDSWLRDVSAQA